MFKEFLQETQPVVYKALKNACENNRISSAYLFAGPAGTPKYEAAQLLAQSIFCENSTGLACEECRNCRRVKDGSYADLVVLDGREDAISKEMVDRLQEQFAKTALEKNGQRVYIIRNCENATLSAQNSMLKFLEEPGEGVTAVLTTDNQSRVLPTILSRCTILPFMPVDPEIYYDEAVKAEIPAEDAYLLAYTGHNVEEIRDLAESTEYKNAVSMTKEYLEAEGMRRNEFLVDYEISWRSHLSDKDKAKKSDITALRMFFSLLDLWFHDVIRKDDHGPLWYHNARMQAPYTDSDCARMIIIVNEERDLVNKFNDLNLLTDQAFYRLEEYNHDRRL